jgi:hypothetical protein
MSHTRRLLDALPAVLAALACDAAAASGWPELPVPPGAQAFGIGDDMRIDGLPIQVRGLLSPEPPARLADWFHARLGQPLVTSEHGGKTILGQFRNGYYLTVQLEQAGGGTRGLVAQSDLRRMAAGHHGGPAGHADWQARLPDGTRILSLVRARDGARSSQHLVLASRDTLAGGAQALTRMLGGFGYAPVQGRPGMPSPGLVLHFQGPDRDAMAVLTRTPDGSLSTVLSTSAPAEGAR